MDESIAAFKKTLEINPKYSDAYYNLGVAYAKKDQLDEAIKLLQKALEYNPDDYKSHFALGVIYQAKRKAKESGIEEKSPK